MEFGLKRRHIHPLNITSLIDVLLLLIIFFMVTTTFVEIPSVDFKLPRVSEAGTLRMSPLIVIIDDKGRIFFEGAEVKLPQLHKRLTERKKSDQTTSLVVKVHRDTRYEVVVQVMTLAANCGFDNVQSPVVTEGQTH